MTPEGKVKANLKRRLRAAFKDAYVFMPVQNGMGAPGLDFYCCIHGMFVAIETKAPGKELTERQDITRQQILAAGGLVFKVSCDAEAERAITTIKRIHQLNVADERYRIADPQEADCPGY